MPGWPTGSGLGVQNKYYSGRNVPAASLSSTTQLFDNNSHNVQESGSSNRIATDLATGSRNRVGFSGNSEAGLRSSSLKGKDSVASLKFGNSGDVGSAKKMSGRNSGRSSRINIPLSSLADTQAIMSSRFNNQPPNLNQQMSSATALYNNQLASLTNSRTGLNAQLTNPPPSMTNPFPFQATVPPPNLATSLPFQWNVQSSTMNSMFKSMPFSLPSVQPPTTSFLSMPPPTMLPTASFSNLPSMTPFQLNPPPATQLFQFNPAVSQLPFQYSAPPPVASVATNAGYGTVAQTSYPNQPSTSKGTVSGSSGHQSSYHPTMNVPPPGFGQLAASAGRQQMDDYENTGRSNSSDYYSERRVTRRDSMSPQHYNRAWGREGQWRSPDVLDRVADNNFSRERRSRSYSPNDYVTNLPQRNQEPSNSSEDSDNYRRYDRKRSRSREHHSKEKDDKKYHCNVCKKSTYDLRIYHRHLKTDDHLRKLELSQREKTFYCQVCDELFSTELTYSKHLESQEHRNKELRHGRVEDKFACYVCKESTNDKQIYFHHMNSEAHLKMLKDSRITKPYVCNTCGRCYKAETEFAQHLESHGHQSKAKEDAHAEKEIFFCRLCDKTTNNMEAYQFHLNSRAHLEQVKEQEKGPMKYSCRVCKKSTFDEKVYLQHLKSRPHLEKQASYLARNSFTATCERCRSTFDNEEDYACHVKSGCHVEREEVQPRKRYSCFLCHKSTHDEKTYLRHLKTAAHLQKEEDNKLQQQSMRLKRKRISSESPEREILRVELEEVRLRRETLEMERQHREKLEEERMRLELLEMERLRIQMLEREHTERLEELELERKKRLDRMEHLERVGRLEKRNEEREKIRRKETKLREERELRRARNAKLEREKARKYRKEKEKAEKDKLAKEKIEKDKKFKEKAKETTEKEKSKVTTEKDKPKETTEKKKLKETSEKEKLKETSEKEKNPERNSHPDKPLLCHLCELACSDEAGYQRHLESKAHREKEAKSKTAVISFECTMCESKFSNKQSLELHVEKCHPSEDSSHNREQLDEKKKSRSETTESNAQSKLYCKPCNIYYYDRLQDHQKSDRHLSSMEKIWTASKRPRISERSSKSSEDDQGSGEHSKDENWCGDCKIHYTGLAVVHEQSSLHNKAARKNSPLFCHKCQILYETKEAYDYHVSRRHSGKAKKSQEVNVQDMGEFMTVDAVGVFEEHPSDPGGGLEDVSDEEDHYEEMETGDDHEVKAEEQSSKDAVLDMEIEDVPEDGDHSEKKEKENEEDDEIISVHSDQPAGGIFSGEDHSDERDEVSKVDVQGEVVTVTADATAVEETVNGTAAGVEGESNADAAGEAVPSGEGVLQDKAKSAEPDDDDVILDLEAKNVDDFLKDDGDDDDEDEDYQNSGLVDVDCWERTSDGDDCSNHGSTKKATTSPEVVNLDSSDLSNISSDMESAFSEPDAVESKKNNKPYDDNYRHCSDCGVPTLGNCKFHGRMRRYPDSPVKDDDPLRAMRSLPAGLVMNDSSTSRGVFTMRWISRCMVFGPFVGLQVALGTPDLDDNSWQVFGPYEPAHVIDGKDIATSNWLRYVRRVDKKDDHNLIAFQFKQSIYYRATMNIDAQAELVVCRNLEIHRKPEPDDHKDDQTWKKKQTVAKGKKQPSLALEMDVSSVDVSSSCSGKPPDFVLPDSIRYGAPRLDFKFSLDAIKASTAPPVESEEIAPTVAQTAEPLESIQGSTDEEQRRLWTNPSRPTRKNRKKPLVGPDQCFRCMKSGHLRRDCPEEEEEVRMFAEFHAIFSGNSGNRGSVQQDGGNLRAATSERTTSSGKEVSGEAHDPKAQNAIYKDGDGCWSCGQPGHKKLNCPKVNNDVHTDDGRSKVTSQSREMSRRSPTPEDKYATVSHSKTNNECWTCGQPGHRQYNCPESTSQSKEMSRRSPTPKNKYATVSHSKTNNDCWTCGQPGHRQYNCPESTSHSKDMSRRSPTPEDKYATVSHSKTNNDCWTCGQPGHRQYNCPESTSHGKDMSRRSPTPEDKYATVSHSKNSTECWTCGQPGHRQFNCPEMRDDARHTDDDSMVSDDSMEQEWAVSGPTVHVSKCWFCGKLGHKLFNCPEMDDDYRRKNSKRSIIKEARSRMECNSKNSDVCWICDQPGHKQLNCPVGRVNARM